MKRTLKFLIIGVAIVVFASVFYFRGYNDGQANKEPYFTWEAEAKEMPQPSPVAPLAEHEVYYPGTEGLKPNEMRIVACGTGMPNARPKQAASCWLVELGNGDKFLFDIGTGSAERISAMKIPMDYLDKVFISHLHSDHFGDFDALWIGGQVANRLNPLRAWGPSGEAPEYGTRYALEHMQEVFKWDVDARIGNMDTRGLEIEINEFDYRGVNKVIYRENGVTIRSIPAIHAIDGSVSFILEWNGLKFAFSGDTYPNKWWIKYAQGADIAVHECFASPSMLIEKQKFPPAQALNVSISIHTSPAQFGKVMSQTKPRMAVGYHFFNDFDTQPLVLADVRKTYDGPLSLAVDYMVWNVTKDEIKVRMAAIDEEVWPQPAIQPFVQADRSRAMGFSKFIKDGEVDYVDVISDMYDEINREYGTNIPLPF